MRSTGSIEIDRPIDEVFHSTIDNVAAWSVIVVEDEILEEKPEMVGTTFRTLTVDHGKEMEFQGIVTGHDPPRSHAIHMTGKMFDIVVEYAFEDLSGRTRVTQTSKVTGKGVFKIILLLTGWLVNKSNCQAVQKELHSLKAFCEEHAHINVPN